MVIVVVWVCALQACMQAHHQCLIFKQTNTRTYTLSIAQQLRYIISPCAVAMCTLFVLHPCLQPHSKMCDCSFHIHAFHLPYCCCCWSRFVCGSQRIFYFFIFSILLQYLWDLHRVTIFSRLLCFEIFLLPYNFFLSPFFFLLLSLYSLDVASVIAKMNTICNINAVQWWWLLCASCVANFQWLLIVCSWICVLCMCVSASRASIFLDFFCLLSNSLIPFIRSFVRSLVHMLKAFRKTSKFFIFPGVRLNMPLLQTHCTSATHKHWYYLCGGLLFLLFLLLFHDTLHACHLT